MKKGRFLLTIFYITANAIFFLPSANSFAASLSEKGMENQHMTEVETGIIFSEEISELNKFCVRHLTCWTPQVSDIRNVENGLADFLSRSKEFGAREIATNLTGYKRKYFAYRKKGERFIILNGLCTRYWHKEGKNFRSVARPMTDMGICYFSVEYHLRSKKFMNLYIDGDA